VPRTELRNAVRIIGGEWRSRVLRFPDAPGLRPTADRVRETLFNWLGQDLSGYTCLDVFAGSGALGFEAASRGAAAVTMVEKSRPVFEALQANAMLLRAAHVRVQRSDALEFLARDGSTYDIVFVDPPFSEGIPERLMELVGRRLAARGRVYLESGTPCVASSGWRLVKQGRAGQVHFHLLEPDVPGEGTPA
jgi:16S rRNA (guanine966-N2)-methyltransferase